MQVLTKWLVITWYCKTSFLYQNLQLRTLNLPKPDMLKLDCCDVNCINPNTVMLISFPAVVHFTVLDRFILFIKTILYILTSIKQSIKHGVGVEPTNKSFADFHATDASSVHIGTQVFQLSVPKYIKQSP